MKNTNHGTAAVLNKNNQQNGRKCRNAGGADRPQQRDG